MRHGAVEAAGGPASRRSILPGATAPRAAPPSRGRAGHRL